MLEWKRRTKRADSETKQKKSKEREQEKLQFPLARSHIDTTTHNGQYRSHILGQKQAKLLKCLVAVIWPVI